MSKVVRLTESDLMKIVKKVIKEQSEMGKDPFRREGGSDPVSKEGGRDFDHFGKIISPQMKAAGFRLVDESKTSSSSSCRAYNGNCCKYFVYPKHSNGVNLGLQCEDSGWKYIVYTHPGSKNLREFKWSKGTNAEVKNAAQQAVDYAIQLKNKMFSSKGSMMEQSQSATKGNPKWEIFAKQLGPTSQKTIKMGDGDMSYNWGGHARSGYQMGISITKRGTLDVNTEDPKKALLINSLAKKNNIPFEIRSQQTDRGTTLTYLYSSNFYSVDPNNVISFIKDIIKNMK